MNAYAVAQVGDLLDKLPGGLGWWVLIAVATVIVVFTFISMFPARYKRCPSNRVLVIYGKTSGGQSVKCMHGGAKFVWPLIQDYAYLSLEPIQIEIPLRGALSIENIRVNVPSVFTVAVGTTPEVMNNAAVRLLGLNQQAIEKQAQEIIFGQLRQVIASMKIEDINRDRDTFLSHIQNSLEPELKKIGLVLLNVNITDITDESGYIDAIGQKAASTAIQQARGDVAEQLKLGETRVAQAERDRSIQVAEAHKDRDIGTRLASRDQAVRTAELDKEQKIGEQTAGFERDASVKDAERAMRIKLAEANAKAIQGENASQAIVFQSQAELAVKQAESYRIGEISKKEAAAAVAEAAALAQAKAALADAQRVEAERRAEVEAPAKAERARIVVEAQAAADKLKLQAEAEAAAIFVKLEAEARGQYEILARKGQALKQIIDACGGAQPAFQLMMLEDLDQLTEASAKAISNIKFDKIVVWEGGGNSNGNGHGSSTANFLQSLGRSLPPMMNVMKDIAGIELPESLIKVASDPISALAPPPRDDSKS